jgi:hypothetical protein
MPFFNLHVMTCGACVCVHRSEKVIKAKYIRCHLVPLASLGRLDNLSSSSAAGRKNSLEATEAMEAAVQIWDLRGF